MFNLIYDAKFWYIVMIIFIILEMTLDGSMVFLLPTGVGSGITGISLHLCSFGILEICSIYQNWYVLLVNTSIFSVTAFFILRRLFNNAKDTPDINDY